VLKNLFRPPSRPFVLELELSVALAYLLLTLLAFFLAQRHLLLSQAADVRIRAEDQRFAKFLSKRITESLRSGSLALPEYEASASPELEQLARETSVPSISLVSLSNPVRRLESFLPGIERFVPPPVQKLAERGWSYEGGVATPGIIFWKSLASEGFPDLALRIEREKGDYSRLRREPGWIVLALAAILIVTGAVLFVQLGRMNRRIGALLQGAVESGLAEDVTSARDETAVVEGAIRRTVSELRKREAELEVLLARERDRAGELQSVSAALRQHMPGGLVAVDGDGTVRDVNRRARELLGIGTDRTGISYRDAFSGSPLLRELISRALSGKETVVREEIEIVASPVEPSGGRKVLTVTAVPVMGGGGRFLGVLVFALDVTAVRELERRLRVRETMASLGDMSAGLAHEMRNAVAAAAGYCRLVSEDLRSGSPEGAGDHLEKVRQELRALEKTVTQFLEFARGGPVEVGPIDLEPVVAEVAGDLASRYSGISFRVEVPEILVLGEKTRLKQIVWNLMMNAVQELDGSAPTCGPAEIAVRAIIAGEGRVELRIEDNGRGVSEEIAGRMFLPFISGREGGTGLGLSLVQQYAVALGGEVRYEKREPPESGSRFVVDLLRRS